jgi:hypothetical protein
MGFFEACIVNSQVLQWFEFLDSWSSQSFHISEVCRTCGALELLVLHATITS